MTQKLDNPATIGAYIKGVIERIDHHGEKAGGIGSAAAFKALVLATMGEVFPRADRGSVEAKEYAGRLANSVWANFGGRRYAFVFQHNGTIEIRPRSLRAAAKYVLDETFSASRVGTVIKAL